MAPKLAAAAERVAWQPKSAKEQVNDPEFEAIVVESGLDKDICMAPRLVAAAERDAWQPEPEKEQKHTHRWSVQLKNYKHDESLKNYKHDENPGYKHDCAAGAQG